MSNAEIIYCSTCKTPRERYQRCKPCANTFHREYRKNNPERVAEHHADWLWKNPTYYKDYYQKNKLVRQAQYRAKGVNERALAMGHPEKVSVADIGALLAKGACEDCNSDKSLQISHLIPLTYKHGTNTIDNLALLCKTCNRAQGFMIHKRAANDEMQKYFRIYEPTTKRESNPNERTEEKMRATFPNN